MQDSGQRQSETLSLSECVKEKEGDDVGAVKTVRVWMEQGTKDHREGAARC